MPPNDPPTPRPRMLVVDADLHRLGYWQENLGREFVIAGDAANGADAVRLAEEVHPEVALVCADLPLIDGYECTRQLCERPNAPVVVMLAENLDFDAATLAMRSGARSLQRLSASAVEISALLYRLLASERQRKDPRLRATRPPGAGIWSFCGAAGGDRRTSLMISVGHELLRMGRSVLVADLDLFFGDVAYYLGLPAGPPDLLTLLAGERFLEPAVLRQQLVRHRSGLMVLKAPNDPEASFGVDPVRVIQGIKGLSGLFDHVLVDMPLGQPPRFVDLLAASSAILAVGSSRAASIKDLGLMMSALRSRPALHAVPCFGVINDMTDPNLIDGFLKRHGEVSYLIPPPSETMDSAIDQGEPYTRIADGDRYSMAVRLLAEDIVARLGRPPRPTPTSPPTRPAGGAP